MDGWVGGWVDGWMGGWVGGWVDGWMGEWVDGTISSSDTFFMDEQRNTGPE